MSPLAWLIGLVLPLCGMVGANGVPPPPPLEPAHLERPGTPNTALAAPEGSPGRPDIITPRFALPAQRVWDAILNVASHQPRTFALAGDQQAMAASWVARSAVWNFPDVVSVRVSPDGPEASTITLYSRSIYGRSDFGVNRSRLQAWLAALYAALKSER